MARRMPHTLYRQRDKQLIARDGDVCPLCVYEAGGRDTGPIANPTIDHLDNSPTNHSLRNLVRMCRAHNAAEGNRVRAGYPRVMHEGNAKSMLTVAALLAATRTQGPDEPRGTCVGERGRERGGAPVMARMIRDRPELDRDDENAATLQDLMPHVFRLWVFEQVAQDGSITQSDAIHAGSEHVHDAVGRGSQTTIGRYWKQITSRAGWLEEARDDRGRLVWVFRAGRDLEELETKLRGWVDVLRESMRR